MGGGTAVGQLIVLLSAPVLTRLYTPEEMGLFSLVIAFVGFVGVGTGLRYEVAVVSAENEREAGLLAWASIFSTVPMAIGFGLMLYGMIRYRLVAYGQLPSWSVPVVVLLLIVTQIFMSLRYWHVRRSNFAMIGKVLVVQGIGRATVPIIAGVVGLGWTGLLLGELAGRMLGTYRMLAAAYASLSSAARGMKRSLLAETCRKYWKFPVVALPSALVDAFGPAILLPLIATLFGNDKAGLFFLVTRLGTVPSAIVSASISDVFHARASEDFRTDPALLRPFLVHVAKKMLCVGSLIYGPIAVLSPFIFGTLFGSQWAEAGILMAVVTPVALVSLVVSPLSRLLLVVNRQEMKLAADLVRVCLPLLGVIAGHRLGLDFRIVVLIYSFAATAGYCFYFFIIWLASKERTTASRVSPASEES
ncbi:MAG: lipopolysaccharide biosynthesis protein [Solirubrobacterales bacterium]